MANPYQDIIAFHVKFDIAYTGEPRFLPPDLQEFRLKFLSEELTEYEEALADGELADALDALVDLVYVALGTAHLHGFDFNEAWRRVHAANMGKIRAPSADASKRGSVFDVIKPEGWVPPDHTDLVRRWPVRFSTPIRDVKVGSILIADEAHDCLGFNHNCVVQQDENGLYVHCNDGLHYLDTQVIGTKLLGFKLWEVGDGN
jgi:predicted HAD superfamily Cof-like phosphohydrolase